jgi:hypothetical protein
VLDSIPKKNVALDSPPKMPCGTWRPSQKALWHLILVPKGSVAFDSLPEKRCGAQALQVLERNVLIDRMGAISLCAMSRYSIWWICKVLGFSANPPPWREARSSPPPPTTYQGPAKTTMPCRAAHYSIKPIANPSVSTESNTSPKTIDQN